MRAQKGSPRSRAVIPVSPLISLTIMAGFGELGYAVVNFSALPPFADKHGQFELVGLYYAVWLIVEAVVKAPVGVLGDRIGRRSLIIAGPLISALMQPLLVFFPHPAAILPIRAIDGAAAALLWPSVFSLVGDRFPTRTRSQVMGLMNLMYMIGVAVAPFVGGHLNERTNSVNASFYLACGLLLFCSLSAALCLGPDQHRQRLAAAKKSRSSFVKAMGEAVARVPEMMWIAFFAFMAVGALLPVVKKYVMAEFGIGEGGFGNLLIIPALVIGLASVGLAPVADRWGKEKSVRLGMGMCLLPLAFAASQGLLFAAGLDKTVFLYLFGAAACFLGAGFVLAIPAWLALVTEKAEASGRGGVVGAVGAAQGIGAVIGGALAPLLYQKISPSSPYIMAALSLAGAWLVVMLKIKPAQNKPE